MMNISAVRHIPEGNERPSSDSDEEEEISPWPEHDPEYSATYSRFSGTPHSQWANLEWSNRNGKSRVHRELPKEEHYPINIFGHSAEQAFADFPRPTRRDDLSGSEDDFAAHYPDPRHRPLHAVSNERHTQRQTPVLSTDPTNHSLPSEPFQEYDYAFDGPSGEYDETDFQSCLTKRGTLVPLEVPSPFPDDFAGDMSAKAKGKQRSYDYVEDGLVPNMQMSGLRLGMDNGTSRPQGYNRPRSSNSGSVYHEDDDDEDVALEEPILYRPFWSIAKALLDQSVDALPESTPTKPTGKKRKVNRYECPVPLCKETFTRRNDVRRHIRNAAIHRDSPDALALIGEVVGTGTRCKFCNADLSRSDARMRHERASACGKRTTQKMKDQMLLMRA
ncbi:hypothetical protein BT96DRAFT_985624 [Gymnopus androsaceus JB14]|uniref:C2H2-type domain-containing protein n=1 Tax=Gymnopus androsaceus JB14 TaxID=1447944 RepID=A0A6A4IJL4_9AGAR|nr:hypothetical protein BT96DRAFT_985624 [Gymnopus androsaceus JB14]